MLDYRRTFVHRRPYLLPVLAHADTELLRTGNYRHQVFLKTGHPYFVPVVSEMHPIDVCISVTVYEKMIVYALPPADRFLNLLLEGSERRVGLCGADVLLRRIVHDIPVTYMVYLRRPEEMVSI